MANTADTGDFEAYVSPRVRSAGYHPRGDAVLELTEIHGAEGSAKGTVTRQGELSRTAAGACPTSCTLRKVQHLGSHGTPLLIVIHNNLRRDLFGFRGNALRALFSVSRLRGPRPGARPCMAEDAHSSTKASLLHRLQHLHQILPPPRRPAESPARWRGGRTRAGTPCACQPVLQRDAIHRLQRAHLISNCPSSWPMASTPAFTASTFTCTT